MWSRVGQDGASMNLSTISSYDSGNLPITWLNVGHRLKEENGQYYLLIELVLPVII